MNTKRILCQIRNGLTIQNITGILGNLNLQSEFELQESAQPDIIFFGPYGDDIPGVGDYLRVGLFPECIFPPLANCDYALGGIDESLVKNNKYIKFNFWGNDPDLIREGKSITSIEKTDFCSFFYSHKIQYRELFFAQLSQYKKVDSPGKSMNNHPMVDSPGVSRYQSKQDFLAKHKFDISFENYIQPGYLTEKIYGALYAGTVPIYFGDPNVASSFINPGCFINAIKYIKPKNKHAVQLLDSLCMEDFNDYRPAFKKSLTDKFKRKVKMVGRDYKMKLLTNNFDFTPLVNYVRDVDNDNVLYSSYLNAAWCDEEKLNFEVNRQRSFWRNIFSKV